MDLEWLELPKCLKKCIKKITYFYSFLIFSERAMQTKNETKKIKTKIILLSKQKI